MKQQTFSDVEYSELSDAESIETITIVPYQNLCRFNLCYSQKGQRLVFIVETVRTPSITG